MKLSSLREVERWVLTWGGNGSVVVKPKELSDMVKAAAKNLLKNQK